MFIEPVTCQAFVCKEITGLIIGIRVKPDNCFAFIQQAEFLDAAGICFGYGVAGSDAVAGEEDCYRN